MFKSGEKMKKRKKILGLVAGLSLICCSFTVSAEEMGKEADTKGISTIENNVAVQEENISVDITVAGVTIVEEGVPTGEKVSGVSYDAENNTLILNNANIVANLSETETAVGNEALRIENLAGSLQIRLEGENNISFTETEQVEYGTCSAIFFGGRYTYEQSKVIITGSGSLNIEHCFDRQWEGICAGTDLIIESGEINIIFSPNSTESMSYTGIELSSGTEFAIRGGTINIDASEITTEEGVFYGIAGNSTYRTEPIEISNATVNIKGPNRKITDLERFSSSFGIDSQCGDVNISNAHIYMDMGTACSAFAFAAGNRINGEELSGGNISIKDSYIECKTNGQIRKYSSYFQDIVGKEKLHFYVGEHAAVKEVPFEEAFKYTDEHMGRYSRYEGQYKCFIISTEEVDIKVTAGDINGDGNVNLVDLMMCLNHVSGEETLADDAFLAADINEDGNVNLTDLMRLLNFLSGESGKL